MIDKNLLLGVAHLILVAGNAAIAVAGWIILKEYKSEYLYVGMLLPSIGLTGAGFSTFAYRIKPQCFTLIGIIISSVLSVIGEIYTITAFFFALGLYHYHDSGQMLAVTLITILLSLQILIFSIYNIVRCYRHMKVLYACRERSQEHHNTVNESDETSSLYTDKFCYSPSSITSSFNTIVHNHRIMGIAQIITGTISFVLGLVCLFVLTDAFTLANSYLGAMVITSGAVTLLSHRYPKLSSTSLWSLILTRASSLWSISTTFSSLLYYLSTALRRETHLTYTVLFIISLWGAVGNFIISICITVLKVKRQRSPFFTFIIFNQFGSTTTTGQLMIRACFAFLGLLTLIVGVVESFVGTSSHIFIALAVGCQLILTGHFGNNLVIKNLENEAIAYFILLTTSLVFIVGYIILTIAEFTTLLSLQPQLVNTGVVAMFCVNEIILLPVLIICIYEAITCGHQVGLCSRDKFSANYHLPKEQPCQRSMVAMHNDINLEIVEAKV
ncbi:hypothetical protein TrispH2_005743 [Trichoplax sp. H2]|nr:hypothetical protein TrispH2_005743 [Trichoplax sp. H2]|eukprot:RDD42589.1 hypothetical protein TrispH2_005743 [Trichoplax sp. H2]